MPSFNKVINWSDFSGICFWNIYYCILNFILLYFFVYIISKSNTSWSWKGGSPPGGPHHGSAPRTLVVENLKIFIFSLEPSLPPPLPPPTASPYFRIPSLFLGPYTTVIAGEVFDESGKVMVQHTPEKHMGKLFVQIIRLTIHKNERSKQTKWTTK